MKKLLLLLAALLVLGGGGVLAFGGPLLRAGIQKGGTAAFGTETRLESATLSILAGKVGLRELSVANPPGFRSERAIAVGRVALVASVPSFLSDTVEIERIEVESPEVTIDLGEGGTNVGALIENLRRHSRAGTEEGEAPPPDGGASKKLHVGLVRVTTPRVTLAQSLVGAASTTIELPGFEMRDLGTGGDGRETTLARLLERLLSKIVEAALASGRNIPPEIEQLLRRETLEEAAEGIRREVERVGEELGKSLETLPQRVKELLPKR
jgi:hypothetical protein